MNEENITARIGKVFNDEIEEIKKQRLDLGLDKKKKSTKTLTNLITRHKDWEKIKKDTIELEIGDKK